jgi:hypothetical protein
VSADLWHQRLGHPGAESLRHLLNSFQFTCNKEMSHTCHACRIGKHVRLPFSLSQHKTIAPFDLIHYDVWTSLVSSFTGFQYYLVLLDDFSHFVWTFPLRLKSNVAQTIMSFHAFVQTQFARPIRAIQTNNGREFDNTVLHKFYSDNGIILRLSCPYTSQQNGRAERILRTLNDGVCALLFHVALPPVFWVEALQTSTYLLNRKPCKPRSLSTPYSLLFHRDPDYTSLWVFGCLCYPNTKSTSPNKLSPRSVACVFIGYSQDHRGYRCYNLSTRKVITSRHVYFDETVFPFRSGPATSMPTTCAYDPWRPDLSSLDPVLQEQLPVPAPSSPRAQNVRRKQGAPAPNCATP